MALRKNFVFLTAGERNRLANAFDAVKTSGELTALTTLHETNASSGIHFGSAYLPWHRWFLRELEKKMQTIEPTVTIPYWDWTRPDSRDIDKEPWRFYFGGRRNKDGLFDEWTLTRNLTPTSNKLPELLAGGSGSPIVDRLAATTFAGFRTIETVVDEVHKWVGGTMATGASPGDPLFWLHHANVDRLWAIWQRNQGAATVQYTTDAAPGDLSASAMVPLNSPMVGGATPASMLDHLALGYSFDTDVRLAGAWESSGRPPLATGDKTTVDLFITDSATDTGTTPTVGPFWSSPDIWVRNKPPGPGEDPLLGHQEPIVNDVNHVYVCVKNRGAATTVPFSVRAYHCPPGAGMVWPKNFHPLGLLTVPSLAAGGEVPVGPFFWTPTEVGHECLVAVAYSEKDDPGSLEALLNTPGIPAAGDPAPLDYSLLVRFSNNVGQRNVQPVLALPGAQHQVALNIRGLTTTSKYTVKIDAGELPPDTVISARLANGVLESGHSDLPVVETNDRFTTLAFDGGRAGSIEDVTIATNDSFVLNIGVDFSFEAVDRKVYPITVQQVQEGKVIGAYTMALTAVKELDDLFFGNPRSRELHLSTCPLWPRIDKSRLKTFERVEDALARGFNGCKFCLPEHDNG